MNTKIETLSGGRLVKVTLLDGSEAEFKIRQILIGEYDKAFTMLEDEIALTAFICGHPRAWANNLSPESYEALQAAAREVNAGGFFAWSTRRQQRIAEQQAALLPTLMKMTPEQITAAVQTGMRLR